MTFVRPGDTLVVVKLDRLGRSTRDVLNLVHELEQRGAALRVLEPLIDTGGPMGKMVLTVLGNGCRNGAVVHKGSAAGWDRGCQGQGRLQRQIGHLRRRQDRRLEEGRIRGYGDRPGCGLQAGERLQSSQGSRDVIVGVAEGQRRPSGRRWGVVLPEP